jgi:hypothetical protein
MVRPLVESGTGIPNSTKLALAERELPWVQQALDTDVDQRLVLAKRIPEPIRQPVLQCPDAFRKIASLDDDALNKLLDNLEDG